MNNMLKLRRYLYEIWILDFFFRSMVFKLDNIVFDFVSVFIVCDGFFFIVIMFL